MTTLEFDQIIGFGEAMLRLSTPAGQTLATASSFDVGVGGAELNGLIAARLCGMAATWVSVLDGGVAAERVRSHAEQHGVSVIAAVDEGARTGSYFVEMAHFPRSTHVSYDRTGSALARVEPGLIDWEEILTPKTCLYITGITPSVSESARASVEEAIDFASSTGASVALDINYRSALWSKKEAYEWVSKVMAKVDILSASSADLAALSFNGDDIEPTRRALDVDVLAVTSKRRNLAGIEVSLAVAVPGATERVSGEATVIDPLGSGDAMLGALLGCAAMLDLEEAVQVALNAALYSYGLEGDALTVDPRRPPANGRIDR